MAVFADEVMGTIGGGHLEFEAIAQARELLTAHQRGAAPVVRRWALGPSLGQCCGGVVHLRFECVEAADSGDPSAQQKLSRYFSKGLTAEKYNEIRRKVYLLNSFFYRLFPDL